VGGKEAETLREPEQDDDEQEKVCVSYVIRRDLSGKQTSIVVSSQCDPQKNHR
jgi:hypothetical protein